MSIILKAAKFAKNAHEGQVRKYSGKPYFTHVAAVAGRTAAWAGEYSNRDYEGCRPIPNGGIELGEVIISAAYLHDIIEDCPEINKKDILHQFGTTVLEMIVWLTNPSKESTARRAERKRMDREYVARAPEYVRRIKLEDRIHNLEEMIFEESDEKFLSLYIKESKELMECLNLSKEITKDLEFLINMKSVWIGLKQARQKKFVKGPDEAETEALLKEMDEWDE